MENCENYKFWNKKVSSLNIKKVTKKRRINKNKEHNKSRAVSFHNFHYSTRSKKNYPKTNLPEKTLDWIWTEKRIKIFHPTKKTLKIKFMLGNCFSFSSVDGTFFVHVLRENGRKNYHSRWKIFSDNKSKFSQFYNFPDFLSIDKIFKFEFSWIFLFFGNKKSFLESFEKFSLFRKTHNFISFGKTIFHCLWKLLLWMTNLASWTSRKQLFWQISKFLDKQICFLCFGMWSDWNYDKIYEIEFWWEN